MLDYQIRSAEGKAEKNPTIILIHGYGSNAEDLFSFAPYLPKSHTIIALQAFKYPEKVRRIIALSGLIHESVPMQKKPEFLAYAAHGTEDTVIKIDQAREYILPLSKKYDEIEYHEFNDGHTVSQENFTALMKWIDKTNL